MATKGRQVLLFSVLWTLSVLVNGVYSDHGKLTRDVRAFIITVGADNIDTRRNCVTV